jgi:hypothetical protein
VTLAESERNDPTDLRIAKYLAQLRTTIVLREDTVTIPDSAVALLVTRPADTDALLDYAAADP